MGKFILCDTGFQMEFENGCTASVQFGDHHYCSNIPKKEYENSFGILLESRNAEVAAFDKDFNFITNRIIDICDDVNGYVSVEDVLDFLGKVRDYRNECWLTM